MSTENTVITETLPRLIAILDECRPVTQQQLIEMLAARHALAMTNQSEFVAQSMYKHIRQLMSAGAP